MKLSWNTCLKVGVSVFVLYLCIEFWPAVAKLLAALIGAATPLLAGALVAFILNIPMSAFERRFFPRSEKKAVKKLRRPVCMIAAVIAVLAIIVLIGWLVVPQLVSCVQLIIEQVPGYLDRMVHKLERWGVFSPETIGMLEKIDWPSKLSELVKVVTSGIGSVAEVVVSTIGSVFSGVITGVLSIIFSIYLLLGKDKLKGQYHRLARRYMNEKWIKKIDYVACITNESFHDYIVGQCIEAVILGVLCMLGMWILRLPYAPMIGALIAFTALIPVAGAFIGGAVGAFLILMVSPMQALIFLIFLVVLQQLEGNIIYPKVVGTSLGLPPIWVLAAVTIGGGVLGILGMLLGVPLTAAIYRILREDIHKNDPQPPAEES
ncbi:MAG: AI-2E family transporter [Oscillospiraceae bacterium]|nr:AI-2E family transporter [Oscillospiraceae bacterium]